MTEVCDRAENLLEAGFPVVVDGAFKRDSERQPHSSISPSAHRRAYCFST